MSWLRSSPLRQSFTRRTQDITQTGTDSKAVFDSFCKHWQQVNEIISRSENRQTQHDDVLAVVNHLDQMVTLLLVELHNCNKITLPNAQQPPAPCLEFMLSENLLDRLFEWSLSTGRYSNGVRLKQLKLYELLVSHSRHQLLVHEPFLRPLLKLLASCQNEIFPDDVSKRLVILLNQLCVVLMQNVHLLDLFFCSTQQHGRQVLTSSNGAANQTNFIIFSLLIPFVHCDGSIGHQARDALLLCMSLSQKNSNIGTYIANHSSMSPVLVTGLCGLYSSLPNFIEIQSIDWFRITADDVNEMPELTLFMNSLEFCNAVVQVAHPLIRDQLLDFLYQGFLVPVLGPAILQKLKGSHLQTNIESQIAAMVYLDLILRSVTDPGLLKIMIKFLLDDEKFDGERILDILIDRINSHDSRLCMVTLALFDTILGLYNEQLMIELILKYLIGASHIPIAQKHKINKIQSYAKTVDYFLELAPEAMKNSNMIIAEHKSLDYQQPASLPIQIHSTGSNTISRTIGANWNHYGLHNTGESLYSNYHAYLYDAHQKIKRTKQSCDQWTDNYFYKSPQKEKRLNAKMPNEQLVQMIQNFLTEFSIEPNTTTTTTMTGNNSEEATNNSNNVSSSSKQLDSLQSIGESSGYESMKYRPDDDDDQSTAENNQISTTINSNVTIVKNIEPWRISRFKDDQIIELELTEDAFLQGTVSLGPFLTSIWSKLQTFTSNLLYVNLHLTGLISHISLYPLPLVHSILLRPDIPTTSDIPSFYQVLKILKQQIDAELPLTEDSLELIDIGRTFLIDREFKLINARKIALESLKTLNKETNTSQQQSTSHLQAYDPFKRQDEKRKSSGNSIMNIFRRSSAAPSSSQNNNNMNNNNINISSGTNQGIATNLRDQSNSLELQPTINDSSALILNVNERHRDLAISAVVMDEFLKELSAISQEMSIVLLNENFMR